MEVQRGIEIIDKLDFPIKNENQEDFKAEIKVEKDIKNEIKDELKPKIEFKLEKIKEEMEVQRGMDIIEKLDPPTKKPKLGLEMTEHLSQKNSNFVLIKRHCGVGDCDFSTRYKSTLMRHKLRQFIIGD